MRKLFALAVVSLPLALAGCAHHAQPTVVYAPPPPGYTAIAQRAYQDGFRAARHDIADGKGPNVERHPHFRNPPVPAAAYEDFRHGFREGYQQAFHSGPGVPPPGAY